MLVHKYNDREVYAKCTSGRKQTTSVTHHFCLKIMIALFRLNKQPGYWSSGLPEVVDEGLCLHLVG